MYVGHVHKFNLILDNDGTEDELYFSFLAYQLYQYLHNLTLIVWWDEMN